MSKDFILPDIGEGIVECEVVEWLVNEGDQVKEDQPIVDVMTDKALVQIPAKEDGVITKLYYAQVDIAKVHEPLYAIQTTGAATAASIAPDATDTTVTTTVQNGGNEAVTDFILPDIGEGIVECEIVEWQVKEGDTV